MDFLWNTVLMKRIIVEFLRPSMSLILCGCRWLRSGITQRLYHSCLLSMADKLACRQETENVFGCIYVITLSVNNFGPEPLSYQSKCFAVIFQVVSGTGHFFLFSAAGCAMNSFRHSGIQIVQEWKAGEQLNTSFCFSFRVCPHDHNYVYNHC